MIEVYENDQRIKKDAGKPRISLVPMQILTDIAEVREYGVNKYGKAESWKSVSIERYNDAMLRHMIAYINDPDGLDSESGIEHFKHLACNVAFIAQLRSERKKLCNDTAGLTKEDKSHIIWTKDDV